jgi:cellulose synthase operon protein C
MPFIKTLQRRCTTALAAIILVYSLTSNIAPAATTTQIQQDTDVFDDAVSRFESGDYVGALIQLKNVLQQDPKNLPARILIGRTYLRIGDAEAADKELRWARSLGADEELIILPMTSALLMNRMFDKMLSNRIGSKWSPSVQAELLTLHGQAYTALHKFSQAEQSFERALTLIPQNMNALSGFARLYLAQGQFENALEAIQQALAQTPNDAGNLYIKGEIRRRSDELEKAKVSYNAALAANPLHVPSLYGRASVSIALGKYDSALADIDKVNEIRPPHMYSEFIRARILLHLNKNLEHKVALKNAYTLMRGYDRKVLSRNLQLLYLAGLISYALNNHQDAYNYLSEYVAKKPFNSNAQTVLASILIAQNKVKEAIEQLTTARAVAPDNPHILRLLGMAYVKIGDFRRAATTFENAITKTAKASSLHSLLAMSKVGLNKRNDAIIGLQSALETEPNARRAGLMLGLLLLQEKRYPEVLVLANGILKKEPDNAVVHNMKSVALWGSGDTDSALISAKRSVALRPNYVLARSNLAKIELSLGNLDAAKKNLTSIMNLPHAGVQPMIELAQIARSESRLDEAVLILEKARIKAPNNKPLQLALIDMYRQTGRLDDAIEYTRELRNKDPENLSVLERMGRIELAGGNKTKAALIFIRMAEIAPANGRFHERIAQYMVQSGDLDAAHRTLVRAMAIDLDYRGTLVSLIRLETKMGRLESALRRANIFIKQHPKTAIGHTLKGDVLSQMNQHSAAAAAYAAGLKLNKSGTLLMRRYLALRKSGVANLPIKSLTDWTKQNPKAFDVRKFLAEAYIDAKQSDKAKKQYESLRESLPKDPDVLNSLAWLYYETGDKRALATAEQAYDAAPSNPLILDTLGWILLENKTTTARGLKLLRAAFARASRNTTIRYHLATALAQAGRKDEALDHLNELIKSRLKDKNIENAKKLRASLLK